MLCVAVLLPAGSGSLAFRGCRVEGALFRRSSPLLQLQLLLWGAELLQPLPGTAPASHQQNAGYTGKLGGHHRRPREGEREKK